MDLASNTYRKKKLLKYEENKQSEIKILLNKLRKNNPTKLKKIKAKEETLSTAKKLLNNRQEVIDAFKTGIFPYIDRFQIKQESEEELEDESDKKKLEKIKDGFKTFIEYTENESKGINYDFFEHYFDFLLPIALVKQLYETKNKKKNERISRTNQKHIE